MTDREFLLHVLGDGEPHSLNEILSRSFQARGCGLTVHSRAADLRAENHNIVNWKTGRRGDGSWYQLLPALKEVSCAAEGASADISLSGDTVGDLAVTSPALCDLGELVPEGAALQLTLQDAA